MCSSDLIASAITTVRHIARPQAMPRAAVAHTVLAVVSPLMLPRAWSRRITPAPMKLIPAISPWMKP